MNELGSTILVVGGNSKSKVWRLHVNSNDIVPVGWSCAVFENKVCNGNWCGKRRSLEKHKNERNLKIVELSYVEYSNGIVFLFSEKELNWWNLLV